MASLATILNRFVGVREFADAPPAVWSRTEPQRLRAIPNEDVYLFVKRINNEAVQKAVDPAARTARTRTVVTGFLAVALVIAGLLPYSYNVMAGFAVQNLKQEQEKLRQEDAKLDLEEANLLSYDHLEELANKLRLVNPQPQQVQFVEGRSKVEARNSLPSTIADRSDIAVVR